MSDAVLMRLVSDLENGYDGYELDQEIHEALNPGITDRPYTTSLDCAKALHDAVLPEWDFKIEHSNGGLTIGVQVGPEIIGWTETSNGIAAAWCAAILKAKLSIDAKDQGGEK